MANRGREVQKKDIESLLQQCQQECTITKATCKHRRAHVEMFNGGPFANTFYLFLFLMSKHSFCLSVIGWAEIC